MVNASHTKLALILALILHPTSLREYEFYHR
jgi:hypothetical protein